MVFVLAVSQVPTSNGPLAMFLKPLGSFTGTQNKHTCRWMATQRFQMARLLLSICPRSECHIPCRALHVFGMNETSGTTFRINKRRPSAHLQWIHGRRRHPRIQTWYGVVIGYRVWDRQRQYVDDSKWIYQCSCNVWNLFHASAFNSDELDGDNYPTQQSPALMKRRRRSCHRIISPGLPLWRLEPRSSSVTGVNPQLRKRLMALQTLRSNTYLFT